MDLLATVKNAMLAIGLIYIGISVYRAIREGDFWKVIALILGGGAAIGFIVSDTFRSNITDLVSELFEAVRASGK